MTKLKGSCKARGAGCLGLVEYSGADSVAAAMPALVFSPQDDDDKVYLQCDGPENHWFAYRLADLETMK